MIVTLNEVQRACQKALIAVGAPPGVDDDGANAAAWLEARGLPALAGLLAALERWAGVPEAAAMFEKAGSGGARAFDARGRSAVFLGPGIVDAAVSGAAGGDPARLEIAALSDPQFLLPVAEALSALGWDFVIVWAGEGTAPQAGAAVDARGGVSLLGDWSAPPVGTLDVAVSCQRAEGAPTDAGLAAARGPADLAARHAATLANGLAVEDSLWRSIGIYAHRALVPASAESRARGAGSGASDNE